MARRTIQKIDGRTHEAKFRKNLRASLVAHLGEPPSITQGLLIDLAVDTAFEIEAFKAARTEMGDIGDRNAARQVALLNAYRRMLVSLGMKKSGVASSTVTLADYLAGNGDDA